MEIFDKIIFALIATLLSTYLLYDYNIYSKAFEVASAESHSYSSIADTIYKIVIEDVTKINVDVKSNQLLQPERLSKENLQSMLGTAGGLQVRSSSVKDVKIINNSLNEPSEAAAKIATRLRNAAADFSDTSKFDKSHVDTFNNEIEKLQNDFISAYVKSIGGVQSSELDIFKEKFNSNVPWEANPLTFLILSALGMVAYLVCRALTKQQSSDLS
jgi:hypothetical protein